MSVMYVDAKHVLSYTASGGCCTCGFRWDSSYWDVSDAIAKEHAKQYTKGKEEVEHYDDLMPDARDDEHRISYTDSGGSCTCGLSWGASTWDASETVAKAHAKDHVNGKVEVEQTTYSRAYARDAFLRAKRLAYLRELLGHRSDYFVDRETNILTVNCSCGFNCRGYSQKVSEISELDHLEKALDDRDKAMIEKSFGHGPVNHPKHYNTHPSGVECIQIIRHMNFNLGNAMKYIWRAGEKDSAPAVQDLEKAVWYLKDEIQRREQEGQA